MQPDDFGQRNKKCCMCADMTDRVIDGQPVCDRHFTEGWGRLPSMPLPQPKPSDELGTAASSVSELGKEPEYHVERGLYPCSKCDKSHTFNSKVGKNHLKHRG